jgi:hypothetical protein
MESKHNQHTDRERVVAASKKDVADDAVSLASRMAGCKVKDDAPIGDRDSTLPRSSSSVPSEAKTSVVGTRVPDTGAKIEAKETSAPLLAAQPKQSSPKSPRLTDASGRSQKLTEEQILAIQDEKVEIEFQEMLRRPNSGEVTTSKDPHALSILSGFKM